MATQKDYYETLGIGKNASEQDIKNAFRNLAKKYHPDVNKEKGAEAKFKEIQEAYAVLSDTNRRKQYDQFGHAAFSTSGSGFTGGFDFSDFDFSDILGEIFGSSFGFNFGRGSASSRARRGRDVIIRMNLSFEEAIFGTKKTINIDTQEVCSECQGKGGHGQKVCPRCHGSGTVTEEQRSLFGMFVTRVECPTCHGEGHTFERVCSKCKGSKQVKVNKDITFTVPAGVDTGNQLRLQGKGEAGLNGGINGDIYIEFNVSSHVLFERDNNDIYVEVPITISEAVLGVKKMIPTLVGKVELSIPSGSQTGDKHRLKGKGAEDLTTKRKGDMYAIIKVVIPKAISKEQKAMFESLKKTTLDKDNLIRNFDNYVNK